MANSAPLYFCGQPIFGTSQIVVADPPELHVSRTFYWGLKGMSEVIGGASGRKLRADMWLHNAYRSRATIENAIVIINSWVGRHGLLKELDRNNNTWLEYYNVTFHGLERQSIGGRGAPDPIYDYAGTVDGGWVQAVTLNFFQLTPQ